MIAVVVYYKKILQTYNNGYVYSIKVLLPPYHWKGNLKMINTLTSNISPSQKFMTEPQQKYMECQNMYL